MLSPYPLATFPVVPLYCVRYIVFEITLEYWELSDILFRLSEAGREL